MAEIQRKNFTDDEIKQAYERMGSVTAVAEHFNVSIRTASRWLQDLGITVKYPSKYNDRRRRISDDEIKQAYKNTGSVTAVATRFNVPLKVASTWLYELGVKVKRSSHNGTEENDLYYLTRILITDDEIKRAANKMRSISAVAEHFNVPFKIAKKWLHDINATQSNEDKKRPPSYEARQRNIKITEATGVTKVGKYYQAVFEGVILAVRQDYFEACCIRKSAENKKSLA
ncbi:hypothetical protein [Vibrio alginolyticus]|uniref:hypothetical protein n=1 Tax=Vibrio alginolyticus TaxID=663 RepID=UPI0022AB4642|nr:hypothetical protein [Vibrio alginolyticus]MCZ2802837.1 hypothetical protein [Vibrio alginolyticus]